MQASLTEFVTFPFHGGHHRGRAHRGARTEAHARAPGRQVGGAASSAGRARARQGRRTWEKNKQPYGKRTEPLMPH